jgi:hypothetical protein
MVLPEGICRRTPASARCRANDELFSILAFESGDKPPTHFVLIIQSGKEAFPLLWVGNSQVIDDSL